MEGWALMADPWAWKEPTRRHDDIRDDYKRLLRAVLEDMARHDLSEHGIGYVRGIWDGIYQVMRLTLSDQEAGALLEDVRNG